MSKKKPHSSAEKQPVNLTISTRVLEVAEEILKAKGQASLSSLVEELIRNDYEKRFGVMKVSTNCASVSEIAAELGGKALELVKHSPLSGGAETPKPQESPPLSGGPRKKAKKGSGSASQGGSP